MQLLSNNWKYAFLPRSVVTHCYLSSKIANFLWDKAWNVYFRHLISVSRCERYRALRAARSPSHCWPLTTLDGGNILFIVQTRSSFNTRRGIRKCAEWRHALCNNCPFFKMQRHYWRRRQQHTQSGDWDTNAVHDFRRAECQLDHHNNCDSPVPNPSSLMRINGSP